jgi:hypothetical protein
MKEERRLLSPGELSLVERTRSPALGRLPDRDLHELGKLLRDCAGEAKDAAARQRDEWRGKAAPHGAHPAASDGGAREKLGLLAGALKRLNKEVARRTAKAVRQERRANAERTLERDEEAATQSNAPSLVPADDEGSNAKSASPFALRSPAKLGTVRQHGKNIQGNRDLK